MASRCDRLQDPFSSVLIRGRIGFLPNRIRQRENRQIQRDQHERHEDPHEDHDGRLDQRQHRRHLPIPSSVRLASPKGSPVSGTGAFVRTSGQKVASLNPARIVHREQLDSSAPNRRSALDHRPAETEMIAPTVASRIEQRDNLSGAWINPGQVRTFAQIATVTGKGEIALIIAPTVLAGYYVLDVMCKGTTVLRKATIFATVSGSGSDEYPRRNFHPL